MTFCMKDETQLKLQSYLDGELPDAGRRDVEAMLAQDPEARALIAELTNTSRALTDFEAGIKVPESREFYWSKIEREISRVRVPEQARANHWSVWLRRLLLPAGAGAAVLIAVIFALPGLGHSGATSTESEDSVVFTYRNYDTGATLVWLDYPAENDFANTGAADTLDLD